MRITLSWFKWPLLMANFLSLSNIFRSKTFQFVINARLWVTLKYGEFCNLQLFLFRSIFWYMYCSSTICQGSLIGSSLDETLPFRPFSCKWSCVAYIFFFIIWQIQNLHLPWSVLSGTFLSSRPLFKGLVFYVTKIITSFNHCQ